ncbi:hypothetical protein JXQ31_10390 [candidate division KSB1 bacterium]|nr:hypothetical protein [candidate division KSB1 bacterium]
MVSELSVKEKIYLDHLLHKELNENKIASVFSQIFLVIAGVIIVGAVIYSSRNMDNRILLGFTFPSVIMGLFTFGLSFVLKKIYELSKEEMKMILIIKKLVNHIDNFNPLQD